MTRDLAGLESIVRTSMRGNRIGNPSRPLLELLGGHAFAPSFAVVPTSMQALPHRSSEHGLHLQAEKWAS